MQQPEQRRRRTAKVHVPVLGRRPNESSLRWFLFLERLQGVADLMGMSVAPHNIQEREWLLEASNLLHNAIQGQPPTNVVTVTSDSSAALEGKSGTLAAVCGEVAARWVEEPARLPMLIATGELSYAGDDAPTPGGALLVQPVAGIVPKLACVDAMLSEIAKKDKVKEAADLRDRGLVVALPAANLQGDSDDASEAESAITALEAACAKLDVKMQVVRARMLADVLVAWCPLRSWRSEEVATQLAGHNPGVTGSPTLRMSDLHSPQFWQGCSEEREGENPTVPFTVVLPSGLNTGTKLRHLALISDAVGVPELCIELSKLVSGLPGYALKLKSVLDIDLISEFKLLRDHKRVSECLLGRNLLLLGTPDINAITARAIQLNPAMKGVDGERPGFHDSDTNYIRDGHGAKYSGGDAPNYGLVGLYLNPFAVPALGQRRRIALVCAGCGAKGTIAATEFLLRVIMKTERTDNNRHFEQFPIRIVRGVGKRYEKGTIKWHDENSDTRDEKFDVGNIEDVSSPD